MSAKWSSKTVFGFWCNTVIEMEQLTFQESPRAIPPHFPDACRVMPTQTIANTSPDNVFVVEYKPLNFVNGKMSKRVQYTVASLPYTGASGHEFSVYRIL